MMMSSLSSTSCCQALFASDLQSSEHPEPTQVRETIQQTLQTLGEKRCVELMAQEYGDHPDTAPARMRWVRSVVSQVYPVEATA
jgi:hypothetical protein